MFIKRLQKTLFLTSLLMFIFFSLAGTAYSADPAGTVETIGELSSGSIVYDANSLWEHKSGNNYSGTGGSRPVDWIVVAKNHSGYPANSVTLLAQGTVAKYAFDDSLGVINGRLEGTNYWINSKIRAWLNSTFYNHFSQDFKKLILTSNLPSHEGGSSGLAYTTNDKIFLPSITELGYIKDNNTNDWAALNYIHESGLDWGFFTGDDSRQVWNSERRYGVAPFYWTRSTYGGRDVFSVNNGFNSANPPLPSIGVRPALNIKANTQVRATEEGKWEIIPGSSTNSIQDTQVNVTPVAGGTGELKKIRELSTGSLVYDANSLWEHRDNVAYTGNGETKPVLWLLVAKNHSVYPGNSVTLLAKNVIAQYAFDNSTDRSASYSATNPNNWGSSGSPNATAGIRPWLNSTFFKHFSKAFQNAVLTTNLSNKTGAPTAIPYITEDKVFIPSATELNGDINDINGKVFQTIGEEWGYFSDNDSRKAAGVADSYWTRSTPSPSFSELFIVSADGSFFYNYARNTHYGVRPVLNIKDETQVRNVGENTWQIVWTEQDDNKSQLTTLSSSQPSTWAGPEIEAANAYGLTTKKVLSNYQTPITREEFCELAVKLYEALSGQKAQAAPSDTFNDTNNMEILKAYNLGIVSGIADGEFAPDKEVTREQIAVMFHRCMQVARPNMQVPSTTVPTFSDTRQVANWAREAVTDMSSRGIITGMGDGRFAPQGNASREQGIALVKRVYEQFQ